MKGWSCNTSGLQQKLRSAFPFWNSVGPAKLSWTSKASVEWFKCFGFEFSTSLACQYDKASLGRLLLCSLWTSDILGGGVWKQMVLKTEISYDELMVALHPSNLHQRIVRVGFPILGHQLWDSSVLRSSGPPACFVYTYVSLPKLIQLTQILTPFTSISSLSATCVLVRAWIMAFWDHKQCSPHEEMGNLNIPGEWKGLATFPTQNMFFSFYAFVAQDPAWHSLETSKASPWLGNAFTASLDWSAHLCDLWEHLTNGITSCYQI